MYKLIVLHVKYLAENKILLCIGRVGGRRKRHSYKMLIVQLVVLAEGILVLC